MNEKTIVLVSVLCLIMCCTINAASVKQEDVDELDWWEKSIFYQIYPRSFKDSNSDGVGDLRGIINKLTHLKEAGIGATWLSPVFKSPMVDFGYDVEDFYNVDELFGTNEDLEALIIEGKRLGIKIILDFVPNHSSNMHPWFIASEHSDEKYKDYYVWRDGKHNIGEAPIPPNNWISVFSGPAWTWSATRQQFYLHQFTKEQPDLNFENPDVVEEMTNILKYWLDKGVDGFRVDAINHMFEDPNFLDEPYIVEGDDGNYANINHIYTRDLQASYDIVYDWRIMFDIYSVEHGNVQRILMTEAYANISSTMLWYESKDGSRKGSHVPFNFALIADLDKESTADDFKSTIDTWLENIPGNYKSNWVLGNHDRPRVGSRYGQERIDQMNMLLMTLPGLAVTYYGEEIGMLDNRLISWEDTLDPQACLTNSSVYQEYTRDPVRTPFQWDNTTFAGFTDETALSTWLPVHPDYESNNLEAQINMEESHFNLYKQLAQLRQEHTFLYGDYNSEAILDNVFTFARTAANHSAYITVLNFGNSNITVDVSKLAKFETSGKIIAVVTHSKHQIADEVNLNTVSLGPYDGLIIETALSTGGSASITLSLSILFISILQYFIN